MTDRREGPPQRPLPPVECPSPVDILPPRAHGYARYLAEGRARQKLERAREHDASCPSVYRLAEAALPEVVEELAGWPKARLDKACDAFFVKQAKDRAARAAEEVARKRDAATGSSTEPFRSYAEMLGRHVEPSRPRAAEDAAERRAIAEEDAA